MCMLLMIQILPKYTVMVGYGYGYGQTVKQNHGIKSDLKYS
jgi:hypothetical protein